MEILLGNPGHLAAVDGVPAKKVLIVLGGESDAPLGEFDEVIMIEPTTEAEENITLKETTWE